MLYEILILSTTGKVVDYKEKKVVELSKSTEKAISQWGLKECAPRFSFVEYEADVEEMKYIQWYTFYDFTEKVFKNKEDQSTYKRLDVIKKDSFREAESVDDTAENVLPFYDYNEEAVNASGKEVNDIAAPCVELNIFKDIGDQPEQRVHFLKAFFKARAFIGVDKLRYAVKNLNYGAIRKILCVLPDKSKEEIKKHLTEKDLSTLQLKWRVLLDGNNRDN